MATALEVLKLVVFQLEAPAVNQRPRRKSFYRWNDLSNPFILEYGFGTLIVRILPILTENDMLVPWQQPLDILKRVKGDPGLSGHQKPDFGVGVGEDLLEESLRTLVLTNCLVRRLRVLLDNGFELNDFVLLQISLLPIHRFN